MSEENEADENGLGFLDFTEPIIKLIIALAVLIGIYEIVNRYPPMHDVTIPIPTLTRVLDVSIAHFITGIITLLVFFAILKFGYDLGDILQDEMQGFPEIKGITVLSAGVIGLLFIHQMSKWIYRNYLTDYQAHYDILFLILGIIVAGRLALLLYMNVDKISDNLRNALES